MYSFFLFLFVSFLILDLFLSSIRNKQIFVLYNPNIVQRDIFLEPNLSVIRELSCTCYLMAKSSTITRCETCEHLQEFQLVTFNLTFRKVSEKELFDRKENCAPFFRRNTDDFLSCVSFLERGNLVRFQLRHSRGLKTL